MLYFISMNFALLIFKRDKHHPYNVPLLATIYLIYDKTSLSHETSTLELLFRRPSSHPIIRSMFGSNIMLWLLASALLSTESTLPNLKEKHKDESYLVFIFIFFTLTYKFRKFIFVSVYLLLLNN